jgi:hypothetical protein
VLLFTLVGGVIAGAGGTAIGGLRGQEIKVRTKPNQGIRSSARNALVTGLLLGLVFGAMVSLGYLVLEREPWSTYLYQAVRDYGIPFGALLGALVAVRYGAHDFSKHFCLRLVLWRSRRAPLDYVRFLEYAVERILLRRAGGGYRFIHRLLTEHLAQREETS